LTIWNAFGGHRADAGPYTIPVGEALGIGSETVRLTPARGHCIPPGRHVGSIATTGSEQAHVSISVTTGGRAAVLLRVLRGVLICDEDTGPAAPCKSATFIPLPCLTTPSPRIREGGQAGVGERLGCAGGCGAMTGGLEVGMSEWHERGGSAGSTAASTGIGTGERPAETVNPEQRQ